MKIFAALLLTLVWVNAASAFQVKVNQRLAACGIHAIFDMNAAGPGGSFTVVR